MCALLTVVNPPGEPLPGDGLPGKENKTVNTITAECKQTYTSKCRTANASNKQQTKTKPWRMRENHGRHLASKRF